MQICLVQLYNYNVLKFKLGSEAKNNNKKESFVTETPWHKLFCLIPLSLATKYEFQEFLNWYQNETLIVTRPATRPRMVRLIIYPTL